LALGRSRATSGLLDRAIAALEPFKNQNRLEDTFALSQNYRKGVYDPVTTAATQLADLAGLQASASSQLTAGSSRALRYYVDRKQHVPRFPNLLQIDASGLTGAERMNRISQYITTIRGKGEEGGFDTPQQMYQKLVGARDNNNRFITETEGAANITKVGGAGTPPPSAGPQTYKDADGKWHIRQQP